VHSHILAFATIDATNDSGYQIKAFLWLVSLGCMLFAYSSKLPGFVGSRAPYSHPTISPKSSFTTVTLFLRPATHTTFTIRPQPSTVSSTQLLLLDLAWYGILVLQSQSLLHEMTLLVNSPPPHPMLLYKDWQKDSRFQATATWSGLCWIHLIGLECSRFLPTTFPPADFVS
jgi:hypothetical protein